MRLADHPFLIDGSTKSFWLDKSSGKKCWINLSYGVIHQDIGNGLLFLNQGSEKLPSSSEFAGLKFAGRYAAYLAELLGVCWLEHLFRDCGAAKVFWAQVTGTGSAMDSWDLPFAAWLRANVLSKVRIEAGADWNAVFAVAMWSIWKRRNGAVFRDALGHPVTPKYCIGVVKEYSEAMERAGNTNTLKKRCERTIKWERPLEEWVKVNTDGAVRKGTGAAAGGVVRDANAQWVGGFAFILGSSSVLMAEGWGVLKGLEMAWKLGFRKVVVETDSKVFVKLVARKIKPSHLLFSLGESCQGFLRRDWSIQFRHIFREANSVADELTALAFALPLGFHVLSEPPTCLSLKVKPNSPKKMTGESFGLHNASEASVATTGGKTETRSVHFSSEYEQLLVHRLPSRGYRGFSRPRLPPFEYRQGPTVNLLCPPRSDGWQELKIGEFLSLPGEEDEVE